MAKKRDPKKNLHNWSTSSGGKTSSGGRAGSANKKKKGACDMIAVPAAGVIVSLIVLGIKKWVK
jgi:hypothetical protein